MSEIAKRYIFQEERDDEFKSLLNGQIAYFKSRVGIQEVDVKEEELIKRFVYENIMNIKWYKDKTKREQGLRRWYIFGTVVLLVLIPVFTFLMTLGLTEAGLGEIELISTMVTVVLTTVIALHRFFSAWIERRKFLSQFHITSTELRNILFRIDNKWSELGAQSVDGVLAPHFIEELRSGTEKSQEIIAKDTQEYFEKLGSPVFDISNALTSSSNVAKQLLQEFQAVDIDSRKRKLEEENKRKREQRERLESELDELDDQLLTLTNQFNALESQISRKHGQLTTEEAKETKYPDTIQVLRDEIDELEEEQEKLEWEINLTELRRKKRSKILMSI